LFGSLADKNNSSAQYWLAHMTELGLGIPRDPAKAVELYKKAAGQGLDAAELRLEEIYLDGDLVTPDFAGPRHASRSRISGRRTRRDAAWPNVPYRHRADGSTDGGLRLVGGGALEGNALAKRERDAALRQLSAADQIAAITCAREILKTIKNETKREITNFGIE
jgi:TPR repeat protein